VRRDLTLFLALVAIGAGYFYALIYVVGVAATLPIPWWTIDSLPRRAAAVALLLIVYLIALALVALPAAWLLRRVFGTRSFYCALVVAAASWVWLMIPDIFYLLSGLDSTMRLLWVLYAVEVLTVLPLVTWRLSRPPSNN
jgi:hypothetical protein